MTREENQKKDNAKQVLLNLIKKENLKILSIDCWNDIMDDYRCRKRIQPDFVDTSNFYVNKKYYKTLDSLDFLYNDSDCLQELFGTVYCLDNITNAPVWLTREENGYYAYWRVNRIPSYYNIPYNVPNSNMS